MAPRPAARQVLWSALLVLAASYAALQVCDCVLRFRAEPVASRRDTVHRRRLPTPAVTLCNRAMDRLAVTFLMPGEENAERATLEALDWERHGAGTVPRLMRYAYAGLDTALKSCQLLGQPCEAAGGWRRRQHASAGDCFTFTPNGSRRMEIGDEYRVEFVLPKTTYIDHSTMLTWDGEAFRRYSSEDGEVALSVYLHAVEDPFSPLPWIQELEPAVAQLGQPTEMSISLEEHHALSQRHAPCESRPEYSRVRCALACHAAAAAAAAGLGCRVTEMPTDAPHCGSYANYSAMQRAYSSPEGARLAMDECHARCPRPCRQLLFRPIVVKGAAKTSGRSSGEFQLRIYYSSGRVEVRSEEWAYSLSAMIGEAGGVIGLMLGLSFVSVVQATEAAVTAVMARLASAKTEPDTR